MKAFYDLADLIKSSANNNARLLMKASGREWDADDLPFYSIARFPIVMDLEPTYEGVIVYSNSEAYAVASEGNFAFHKSMGETEGVVTYTIDECTIKSNLSAVWGGSGGKQTAGEAANVLTGLIKMARVTTKNCSLMFYLSKDNRFIGSSWNLAAYMALMGGPPIMWSGLFDFRGKGVRIGTITASDIDKKMAYASNNTYKTLCFILSLGNANADAAFTLAQVAAGGTLRDHVGTTVGDAIMFGQSVYAVKAARSADMQRENVKAAAPAKQLMKEEWRAKMFSVDPLGTYQANAEGVGRLATDLLDFIDKKLKETAAVRVAKGLKSELPAKPDLTSMMNAVAKVFTSGGSEADLSNKIAAITTLIRKYDDMLASARKAPPAAAKRVAAKKSSSPDVDFFDLAAPAKKARIEAAATEVHVAPEA